MDEFIRYAHKHPENLTPNAPYEHQTTAKITLSGPSLISLYLLEDEFLGGAHGNQAYEPMSFGLVHGRPRRLQMEDLFRPGQRARWLCADRLLAKLRDNPRAESVRDGSVTRAKLAQQDLKFAITPRALLFLFDPYQLGSYAAGMFEVPVPFAEFGDALDTAGPLKPLLASPRPAVDAAHRPRAALPGLQAVSIILQRAPTHYRFDRNGAVLLDPYGATALRFLIRNEEEEPVTVSFNALYYRGAKPAAELVIDKRKLKRVVVPSHATRSFIVEVGCKDVKPEPATIVFRVETSDKTRFISYTLRYTPDPGSE